MNYASTSYSQPWQSAFVGGDDVAVLKVFGVFLLICAGIVCVIIILFAVFYAISELFGPKRTERDKYPSEEAYQAALAAQAAKTAQTTAPQSFTNRPWYLI